MPSFSMMEWCPFSPEQLPRPSKEHWVPYIYLVGLTAWTGVRSCFVLLPHLLNFLSRLVHSCWTLFPGSLCFWYLCRHPGPGFLRCHWASPSITPLHHLCCWSAFMILLYPAVRWWMGRGELESFVFPIFPLLLSTVVHSTVHFWKKLKFSLKLRNMSFLLPIFSPLQNLLHFWTIDEFEKNSCTAHSGGSILTV